MTALAALIEDALHGLPAIDGDPYGRYHAARALDHAWSNPRRWADHRGRPDQEGERSMTATDLTYMSQVVGHAVESTNDLTRAEASRILDALRADAADIQEEGQA